MENYNYSNLSHFVLRAGRVSTGRFLKGELVLDAIFKCSNRNFDTPGQAAQACLEGICSCSSYIQVQGSTN